MKNILTVFILIFSIRIGTAQISSMDTTGVVIVYDSSKGYTGIKFTLIDTATLSFTVFDRWGSIDTLFLSNSILPPDKYTFEFVPKDSIVGVYIYLIQSGSEKVNGNITYFGKSTTKIESSIAGNSIKIGPNPTSGFLSIELNANRATTMKVFNIQAQLIMRKIIKSSSTIDLSCYPNGIYFIEMTNGKRIIRSKIIKK